nr:alpha/beta fold hydrolase [uncultured Sphaerochaeta sp.]
MKEKAVLYIHGKHGSKEELDRLKPLLQTKGYDGYAIDLPGHGQSKEDLTSFTPWGTKPLLQTFFGMLSRDYSQVTLLANSIGCYFSMHALQGKPIDNALFISPILSMERLITDMIAWAGVTEAILQKEKEIHTEFGEILSWDYLQFVRKNPINWEIPTSVLYAGHDTLTSRDTVDSFVNSHNADLTVYEKGEHWFHTPEQLEFLDQWIQKQL